MDQKRNTDKRPAARARKNNKELLLMCAAVHSALVSAALMAIDYRLNFSDVVIELTKLEREKNYK